MRRSLLVLLLLLAPLASARNRAVGVGPPLEIPQADAIAAAAIERGVPGVVIGVRKGNAFYAKAWGDYDVEAHVPEHAQTIHQIASVSKQFTAAAIMRLVEQGKLRLDDRASRYVTELDRERLRRRTRRRDGDRGRRRARHGLALAHAATSNTATGQPRRQSR